MKYCYWIKKYREFKYHFWIYFLIINSNFFNFIVQFLVFKFIFHNCFIKFFDYFQWSNFNYFLYFNNFRYVQNFVFHAWYWYVHFNLIVKNVIAIVIIITTILENILSLNNFEINYYHFLHNNCFNFHLIFIKLIIYYYFYYDYHHYYVNNFQIIIRFIKDLKMISRLN